MRIGVFGGTFDPPHLAHLVLAEEAMFQLDLERVLWVLTPESPFKSDVHLSTWQQRLELLEAALSDNPSFELSRVDVDRPAPHYAYETLQILGETYSKGELVYLMGGDSLQDFPEWKQPQSLLDKCHSIGVMRRYGHSVDLSGLELDIPGLISKLSWIDTPLIEISGTNIRERLKGGDAVRYYLHPAVYQIIHEKGLYQT